MNFRKGSLLPLRPHRVRVKAVQTQHSVVDAVREAAVTALVAQLELPIPIATAQTALQKREASTRSVVRKLAILVQHHGRQLQRQAPQVRPAKQRSLKENRATTSVAGVAVVVQEAQGQIVRAKAQCSMPTSWNAVVAVSATVDPLVVISCACRYVTGSPKWQFLRGESSLSITSVAQPTMPTKFTAISTSAACKMSFLVWKLPL